MTTPTRLPTRHSDDDRGREWFSAARWTTKPAERSAGILEAAKVSKKYDRKIWDKYEDRHAVVDVYRVLDAFDVRCPATAHAVKKLLCAGIRGHKDMEQDLAEAAQSIEEARAMVRQKRRSTEGGAANGQ